MGWLAVFGIFGWDILNVCHKQVRYAKKSQVVFNWLIVEGLLIHSSGICNSLKRMSFVYMGEYN